MKGNLAGFNALTRLKYPIIFHFEELIKLSNTCTYEYECLYFEALKTALEDDPTSGFGQSPGITTYCPCALSGEVTVTLVPANLAPPPPPAAADATAELSALSIGGLAINPDFSSRVYEYSATATAATTSVIVSFTLLGAGATVSFTAEPKVGFDAKL